jgi:predicted nucleic acid-binding protein
MKILVDTNIFIASMRFSGLKRKLVWKLMEEDVEIVLTDFILWELQDNFAELYTPYEAQSALNSFLQFLSTGKIEVKTLEDYQSNLKAAQALIVEKDAPILATLMLEDIDYLLTRDKKDFLRNLKLQKTPWIKKIKSPQELLALL